MILYTGKYMPHFIFVPFVVVVSRQIYNLVNSNDRNYLSWNTTLSEQIYNGTKLLASEERQKMIRCKINFVYSNNALGKLLLQKQSTIVCVSDTSILLVRKSKYACILIFFFVQVIFLGKQFVTGNFLPCWSYWPLIL